MIIAGLASESSECRRREYYIVQFISDKQIELEKEEGKVSNGEHWFLTPRVAVENIHGVAAWTCVNSCDLKCYLGKALAIDN